MSENLLHLFLILPFLGFVISLTIPNKEEGIISRIAYSTAGLQLFFSLCFVGLWIKEGFPTLNIKDLSIFKAEHYEFYIDFYFDRITAVYLVVGALLTSLIMVYSQYYMHREKGYKRFFNTTLLFFLGYNIVIFSGNLETLFIGWEILGISSFLLIGFYRDRYLPVKNAVKVFSIYRIGDIGIILAMWMSHHFWHENVTFMKLNNAELVHEHLTQHSYTGTFISLMLLLAAAAKSAQLPFTSWLPRAMEGPTPSSAIFYGSLSVHIGAFLLLRTHHFWEHQVIVVWIIGLLGFVTMMVATGIARVQSSIKSQVAYASAAQIGLIFIEIAMGWEVLALIHFAGNAFLRTYQLLVSPSVVTYLIREQFYNVEPQKKSLEDYFPQWLEVTLYQLCLKEWGLDNFMYNSLWNPLKKLGGYLGVFGKRTTIIGLSIFYVAGFAILVSGIELPTQILRFVPEFFALIGLLFVMRAFTERRDPIKSWVLVILNHFWIALAVSFNEHFTLSHVFLYLSGIVFFGIVGFMLLRRLKSTETIGLDRFYGHSFEHPRFSMVFLFGCLGVMGFPISPSFVGEDLIFSHIHETQFVLAVFVSLSFIMDGLALVRLFARVFLGPHAKTYHEVAYRSS